MQRRDALRLLATGAILHLAPGKMLAVASEARMLLDNQPSPRTLNPHQGATVKAMAELILPRTDTPGATDVSASAFIDLILTEWYDESLRRVFLDGIANVDSRSQALFAKDFVDCSATQQGDILIALGDSMIAQKKQVRDRHSFDPDSGIETNFYAILRRLTLTAYYTSEAGATDELHFEIIPGRYQGCTALSSDQETLKK